MFSAALVAAVLLFGSTSIAQAHRSPKVVAWQLKTLTNKNLKFGGSKIRVRSMICASRGYPNYICKAHLSDGTGFEWPLVRFTDAGLLTAKGGFST